MKEQSVLFVLCHEFIKISRALRYSKGNLKSLPAFVLEVFSCAGQNVLAEFDLLAQETLYYIAGWTIHAAHKVAPRRCKDTCHSLVYFANTVVIENIDSDERSSLPTGKVDRFIHFGALRYASYSYFVFISRIETVFCNILSEEYIVALGPNIVDRIRIALKNETRLIDLFGIFMQPDISPQTFDDTLDFILLIYSRMRGKDFAMKLLKKCSFEVACSTNSSCFV